MQFLEILILIVPLLISIAYLTLAERKVMGAMQRRLGPNKVGVLGVLQPFADGLKLVIKETILVSQANKILFLVAPYITLVFSILAWAVIPFSRGIVIADLTYSILYILLISSLGVLGIILAGWSANSKYALLGSLRTTAQMISYEVIMGIVILMVVFLADSMNLMAIVANQKTVWNIIPLLPIALIFFIAALAETNRAPFDLPEAESELVAGFMTEHSSLSFAYFFLGEYGNIILISTVTAILFLGGYLVPVIDSRWLEPIGLGFKTSILLFMFIWIRASFPRLRFDQLMLFAWTGLLPIILGYFVLVASILVAWNP
uniref:NADH dehydrogenase subunit 1 n=1 Tax=Conidiobolus chlamydosporus TaxID=1167813 RepID=UPI001D10BE1E|nr:NADH dehydrogenase subunit 1 [Conidiobolus chlamydosporus]QZZ81306.1 NADH dehydrogenase subunit 1 [Conidiobolus chlamydosporus]